ncbi:MAG: DNA-3-methyladenine glycosylase 2 family protein [Candidatus Micrarchaeota archaeon]|nr:DNA-3-methyladenine glycosylase 2 family protein [Candidatus Micrarchaeota archaeon]
METETILMEHSDTIRTDRFDIRHTFESGQPLTFHADYTKPGPSRNLSYATVRGRISVASKGNRLSYDYIGDYSASSARNEVVRRFALADDMQAIYAGINTDPFMDSAIRSFNGMRITENDPWEATLCFIISQFNNIKRIRLITRKLIERFGETYGYDNKELKLFPSASAIADASLEDIKVCGTGFRAEYIKSAATACTNSLDLQSLYPMDYEPAKSALMELDGVGDKVADCILLFGYRKMEAFPIDTWIKRVMETVYFKGRKKTIKELHRFAERRWEPEMLGYAQQYLFHNARSLKVGR